MDTVQEDNLEIVRAMESIVITNPTAISDVRRTMSLAVVAIFDQCIVLRDAVHQKRQELAQLELDIKTAEEEVKERQEKQRQLLKDIEADIQNCKTKFEQMNAIIGNEEDERAKFKAQVEAQIEAQKKMEACSAALGGMEF